MKKIIIIFLSLFPLLSMAQKDCKIPTYLDQISSFEISACIYSEYNEYGFTFTDAKGKYTKLTKAGNYYRFKYEKKRDDTKNLSGAYIRNNYYNAVIKANGEDLSNRKQFFKFKHDDKTVYMLIEDAEDNIEYGFNVHIIEETPMEQELEISIKDGIEKDGKIPLYGIFFDTDKSVIKPESDKELTMLVNYLNNNPTVKIYVVGHTDNVGELAHNMKLSKDRSAAVVAYLVSKGIAQTRLSSEGVGPFCPVTSNATEEGKAKNRRVEIVLK